MFLFGIYVWEPCPPLHPPALSAAAAAHLFLLWINWKHVSRSDKYQRGQAARLLWILELLLFYFSFWTEDKRGLNKHAEPTAACCQWKVTYLWYSAVRQEKLFKLIWHYLTRSLSDDMLLLWHSMWYVCERTNALMDPTRSDWNWNNVILYSADGRQGCIITITAKLACREHLIML